LQHPAPENAAGPASPNLTANDCNIPLRGKECRDKENRTEKWQQDQLCPLVIIATSHSVGLKLRHPRRWKWKNFFAGQFSEFQFFYVRNSFHFLAYQCQYYIPIT
jgi:hypothetical protein